MKKSITTIYRTSDNQEFDDLQKAAKHQDNLDKKEEAEKILPKFEKFAGTITGKFLLSNHDLNEFNTWVIHSVPKTLNKNTLVTPVLFIFKGELIEAIKYALKLKDFTNGEEFGAFYSIDYVKNNL
ncbi:MAG: hypothetical protein ACTTIS_00245 [Streptobacillus sp.]